MQHPYITNTRRAGGLSMSTCNRRRHEHHGAHRAAVVAVAMLAGALIVLCVMMTLG